MSSLSAILKAIDWRENIKRSLSSGSTEAEIERATRRIAVWSNQLEILDQGNPALSFVREMQSAIQNSGLLISLCLYKASAASSRTLLETCLYYTYFRTHPSELATLVNDPKYYVSKGEIVDYHKIHTPCFKNAQAALSLVGNLESWYSKVSAVVHGQIPGAWNAHAALTEISFSEPTHALALATMLEGEQLVNNWLIATVAKELWAGFAPDAKAYLLKGLSGGLKATIGLTRNNS